MKGYFETNHQDFIDMLTIARSTLPRIRQATTAPEELPQDDVTFYLKEDSLAGYGITDQGELIGVFSMMKGQGDNLMKSAIEHGADHLDCFDGYLPSFYAKHGFRVTKREANWTEGEPDVVFMALAPEHFLAA